MENARAARSDGRTLAFHEDHPILKPFLTTSMHVWNQDLFGGETAAVTAAEAVGTGVGTGARTMGAGTELFMGLETKPESRELSRRLLGFCPATGTSSRSA